MRILGLDSGGRRIGVAMSDAGEILASPLLVIEKKSDEEAIATIVGIVRENGVGQIIVGMPRHLNGTFGAEAAKVQLFIDELARKTEVPIETRDEWLSTVAANRLLRDAGAKTSHRRVDAMAAAFVLQGYLDSKNQANNADEDGNIMLT
jgi:putative Holliday junction resolvase